LVGFRRTLVGGACLSAASTAAFALLHAATPPALIVLAVLASGCLRSIQYLALNTISYAEMPSTLLSHGTSVGGGAQQLDAGHFREVYLLVALIPLASAIGFLRLAPDDGAEVSGHQVAA